MHELFRARKVELKTQRTVAAVARAAREEEEAAKVFFFEVELQTQRSVAHVLQGLNVPQDSRKNTREKCSREGGKRGENCIFRQGNSQ